MPIFQIYEVAKAFQSALKTGEWKDVAASISKCDTLLMATISGNIEKVAELIELAHDTYTSILKYNDENSLSCVLTRRILLHRHIILLFGKCRPEKDLLILFFCQGQMPGIAQQ